MGNSHKSLPALTVALVVTGIGAADIGVPRFFASWEAGQIEEAFDRQNLRVDKEFINHASVWTLQEARLSGNAKVSFGIGGAYFFVFPRNLGGNPYANSKRSAFGLTDAHGEFEFWKGAVEGEHGLLLKAGIFGYKYNPDAKNLGEYLFRTWTYPTVINTGGLDLVNSAGAQLSGLAANTKKGVVENDLLLTIQTDHVPISGLSLTDIVSCRLGILTVGAGFMLDNFYHPDPNALSPKGSGRLDENKFYTVQGGDSLPAGTRLAFKEYKDYKDSLIFHSLDSLLYRNPIVGGNDTIVLDSGYYSFAGQKAMIRASLDFAKLFSHPLLSEKDLSLYFEATLLGFKNYPTFYEKTTDRAVYMIGANLPAFRLLDQLSVELEYSPAPFLSSTTGPNVRGVATPIVDEGFPNVRAIHDDDWKWSVYAQRKIGDNFSIYAQIANDHFRNAFVYGAPATEEFLIQNNHWYWVLKLAYSI